MKRKSRPYAPDLREDWQVAQGLHCPCGGFDEMCVCQNVDEPWRYGRGGKPPSAQQDLEQRIRELEGTVRTLELQQQTDRQTIASFSAARPAEISTPDMPGQFEGDIWFGDPVKRNLGTHRWENGEWVLLPSELESVLELLAVRTAQRDTALSAARPAVVSDEVVDCYCGGFGPRGSVEHREGCPELDEDRRQRAAFALLPGGVPDREAIAAIVRHAMQEFASSEVQQSPFGERVDALKNGGDIAADAIITMLSGPAVPDGWSDLEMAEAFYRAMYEDQGGKWYAVDPSAHPFWIKASQKFVRAMLSASPKEVSPDPTHGRRE